VLADEILAFVWENGSCRREREKAAVSFSCRASEWSTTASQQSVQSSTCTPGALLHALQLMLAQLPKREDLDLVIEQPLLNGLQRM